ncbi:hypothetical protein OTB20_34290 [Streptomyces sp. H27-H1]|uniref:hypothetical protein n=2 Tax=unclassified Streptomyces TaxID=2593676 RepID=UPI002271DA2C|nr:hypothetical protein [Streptomyces sp. H27-H1]MCY0931166.1 hypothetical protein [Streptomyces sp. H27-H1]
MSTDTAATPRLSLVDLYILGDLIVSRLGEDWTKPDDTTDTDTVSFDHTAGHTISIRRLWDGVGAQTSLRMEGQPAYNAGVVFSDSAGTSDTLLKAIEERLLPAINGHRPKLQQSGTPHPPPEADTEKPPAGAETAKDAPADEDPTQPNSPPAETAPAPPAAMPSAKKTPAAKPKTAATAKKTTTPRRAAKTTVTTPKTTKRATTRKATTTTA